MNPIIKECKVIKNDDTVMDIVFDTFKFEKFVDGLEVCLLFKFYLNNTVIAKVYYDFVNNTHYEFRFIRKIKDTFYYELYFNNSIIL